MRLAGWLAALLIALAPPVPVAAREAAPTCARGTGARPADLPREAQDVLRAIERGGPFPYAQDGSTFGNRERRLPAQARGYYREYTVRTPGRSDRGARRIVAGEAGDRWYTADHYRTFRCVEADP
jgi:ribonuclease T1